MYSCTAANFGNFSHRFINRKSFSNLANIDKILFENVFVKEDVSTEAFYNVTVNQFLWKNLKIREMDKQAKIFF